MVSSFQMESPWLCVDAVLAIFRLDKIFLQNVFLKQRSYVCNVNVFIVLGPSSVCYGGPFNA